MARLGDIVTISAGMGEQFGDRVWLLNLDMVEQQTGNIIAYNYVSKDELNGSIIQFDTDNVLYSKLRPNLNKVVLPHRSGFATSEMLPLKPDIKFLSKEYLAAYLRSDSFVTWATSKTAGAKMPRLGTKELLNKEIPLPPLDEQHHIAKVLDKLSGLIALQKHQFSKLDKLIKSRFIELFGVFPANPMEWETGTIRDIVTDVRYGSSRPAVEGGKYPYLRMNNITYDGELDLTDTKRIDIPDNELEKCTVRRGDVLFNRTNSKELVGKTCVYDRDEMMVLAGFVIRVRVTDRVLPEFLSAFLNTDFSKKMLAGMCKTAIGQANINAQEMQNIGIYLPPIELQCQFVQFKKQVDKSKFEIQKSLETLKKHGCRNVLGEVRKHG